MTQSLMLSDVLELCDVIDYVSEPSLSRGMRYFDQGRVTKLQADNSLMKATAQVQGSGKKPYAVDITFTHRDGLLEDIDGFCTCPVGYNCKHVAATLMALLAGEGTTAHTLPAPKPVIAADKKPVPVSLPPSVTQWLDDIGRLSLGNDYPATLQKRLLYVLKAHESKTNGRVQLAVKLTSVQLLKGGNLSPTFTTSMLQNYRPETVPKFYRASDIEICDALLKVGRAEWGSGDFIVRDEKLLAMILATGRARWDSHTSEPLTQGPSRPGRIEWYLASKDGMRPRIVVEDAIALNAQPPVYVDPVRLMVGTVDLGMDPEMAFRLLNAPTIAPDLVEHVAQMLNTRAPQIPQALLPTRPEPPITVSVKPRTVLHLTTGETGSSGYQYYQRPSENLPIARLHFRYQQFDIPRDEKALTLESVADGRMHIIHRDLKAEKAQIKVVHATKLERAGYVWPNIHHRHREDYALRDSDMWLDFLVNVAPGLAAKGIDVELDDAFPYRLLQAGGDFEAAIESPNGSGIDWFELHLGVTIDGKQMDIGPLLAALVQSPTFDPAMMSARAAAGNDIYVPVSNGQFIALAADRFLPIILALHELKLGGLWVAKDGKVRISRAEATLLLSGETTGVVFRGADNLRHLAKLFGSDGPAAVSLPDTFTAQLRPYQAAGVAWLNALREVGLGGILADDMGLGKTVQVLALLSAEKAADRLTSPAIIIAPTSLMTNWINEAAKFAPDLRILLLHGPDRQDAFDQIPDHDVVLTTYPLISRDHKTLLAQAWSFAILDEAQTIKNPNATTTRLLRDIRAQHRFCLSGTPMENHLGELWSLMSFVNPGYLGDKTQFARNWRTPIEKTRDTKRSGALARRVRPFMLRRTKAEVANDLPAKSEMIETIALEGKQRDLYDSIRLAMHEKVRNAIADRGLAKSHIIILDALLKLRQACCDPQLLKLDDKVAYPSAKLERLLDMVTELLAEGRRIIVFSQFTSMLALIGAQLDAQDVAYSLLTGDTKDRKGEIDRFQDGKVSLFLISLKAGGVGLNLTAADTVILYDPWWNPAVEEQAIDRAYRIGQDKPVFVYRLVAQETIEDKMAQLKARKRALADSLFDTDGNPTAALTEDDVTALLAE